MPPQGRLLDISFNPIDVHLCPLCPHPVKGPAIMGSPNVFVNKLPALRITDKGIHLLCCGPNKWMALTGSMTVFINKLPAHRLMDKDLHCGGLGFLVKGSPNVITGG